MKKLISFFLIIVLVGIVVFTSCKKELTNNQIENNKAPIAVAGPNQLISLPTDSVLLDGNSSSDPDGKIAKWLWAKISGPSSFRIVNANAMQTQVTNLVEGVYQFELKVADDGGVAASDTMTVTVNVAGSTVSCDNRATINASLVQVGRLSEGRIALVSATAGSKIVFAGGMIPYAYSSRVDIYDTITKQWSLAELTIPERQGMAVATIGSKIFFAGGQDADLGDVTSRVDIYDAATNKWSIAELSAPRAYLSAVTIGNKIFFAGGANWAPLYPGSMPNYFVGSKVIDIYDNTTGTWSTTTLSEGRYELSATAVGSKLYFAGGLKSIFEISNKIDIFDTQSNTWSTSQLHEAKAGHASIAVGDKILWAGGAKSSYWSGPALSNQIEIKDLSTGASSFICIIPKRFFKAIVKDHKIIFFTGNISNDPNSGTQFEIYDIVTHQWSTGVLNIEIYDATVLSVNNTIYVAGGRNHSGGPYYKEVWKLEF